MAAADTPNLPEGDDAQVGRRVVLRGISAMGLAAFAAPLAACGGGDDNGVAAPDQLPAPADDVLPSATPSATGTKTPKPARSAKPTGQATAANAERTPKATPKPEKSPKATPKAPAGNAGLVKDGPPIGDASQVKVNSGALFESAEYVVTQPKAGQYVGFDSLCTHEGCPVDVFDTPGQMICSCHNSVFKITDGSVVSGPARGPLPKKPVIVEGGKIYKAKPA